MVPAVCGLLASGYRGAGALPHRVAYSAAFSTGGSGSAWSARAGVELGYATAPTLAARETPSLDLI